MPVRADIEAPKFTAGTSWAKQFLAAHPSSYLARLLLLCLLSRIALATSDKNPRHLGKDDGAVSGARASSSNPYEGHRRAVSLSKNAGGRPGKSGTELRDIERQKLRTSKAKPVPHPTVRTRSGPSRNASINFPFAPANQRGKTNALGNGSGAVRSGIGRRVSEKRR